MKKIWFLILFTVLSSNSYGSEFQPGEDQQKVNKLIDCQQYMVEKLSGAHVQITMTICFYDAYFIRDGKEEHFILSVKSSPHVGATVEILGLNNGK